MIKSPVRTKSLLTVQAISTIGLSLGLAYSMGGLLVTVANMSLDYYLANFLRVVRLPLGTYPVFLQRLAYHFIFDREGPSLSDLQLFLPLLYLLGLEYGLLKFRFPKINIFLLIPLMLFVDFLTVAMSGGNISLYGAGWKELSNPVNYLPGTAFLRYILVPTVTTALRLALGTASFYAAKKIVFWLNTVEF